ncbi:MAG: penicillin-binding transpeptidase domain-containing protein [Romboutsia sp.]|uniref:penicillin-binding transpeptidase domain-containing protein n=1 Tax=Romboutsia sp. TaxID=1965302 RepID=UPI003F3AD830
MEKLKLVSKIIALIITITLTLVGCSKGDEIEKIVKEYTNIINEGKYEQMYELLSQESKSYISKDKFVERYTKIYSAIGVNNIKIELGEVKNKLEIPISISMNTIAGKLEFEEIKLNLVKDDKDYKINWNESLILPSMIKGDSIKVETTKASRGKILDRDDNILASDSQVNKVYIHPSVFELNREENIFKMATILDISESYIIDALDKNTNKDNLVPIVKIANNENKKIDLISQIEGVKLQMEACRVYSKGEAFGNLIGYIGNITKEELEKNIDKGYSSYSQIGKNGLEKIYEEKLRAIEGIHLYIERGSDKITIVKTQSENGKDIKLAIDSSLQEEIYNQMNNEKGASIAVDSKSGEVLAMVSSPSYDSNTLVTYKTKSIAKVWEESKNAQFENRANNVYSPGSTMKLLTSAIGLENNIINLDESMNIDGLEWQNNSSWGNYKITRVKDPNKPINLYNAVKYSDNIYFADKAIKIGEDKYIKGCLKFGIGEEVPFEYPMQKSQISNDNKLDKEILLADTGYGQGQVLMSPLDIAMCYSALGNEGKIMIPRLVISENSQPKIYKDAIEKKYMLDLINSFSSVINDEDGSGRLAKIEDANIIGKTGTAEIKQSKDDNSGSENGWFVAVNIDEPNVAISMIIQDVKDKNGSEYVVPKVKNAMESYLENNKSEN